MPVHFRMVLQAETCFLVVCSLAHGFELSWDIACFLRCSLLLGEWVMHLIRFPIDRCQWPMKEGTNGPNSWNEKEYLQHGSDGPINVSWISLSWIIPCVGVEMDWWPKMTPCSEGLLTLELRRLQRIDWPDITGLNHHRTKLPTFQDVCHTL